MRVLAVMYCFPPLLVPAAVRYLKMVLGLRELGVEVEPILIDPRSFAAPGEGLSDPGMLRLVPADLRTHVVWSPENHPFVRLLKRASPVRDALRGVFEPKKREWTLAARRTLRDLDLGAYDAVLSCSQPHANHLLGRELAARGGLPWVAWFGDPWAGNPYARPASPSLAAYQRSLEESILRQADLVFYTSEEMLRLVRSTYPEILDGKSGVLPHLFVPEWYEGGTRTYERKARIEILHTGHFYGPRSPRPLLEVLGRLHREASLEGSLHIASYGNLLPADRERVRELGLGNVFEMFPVVPYLESLSLMKQTDYLLIVDAQIKGSDESVFLPSKLIDYLGSGKPVLAFTPAQGASARVVAATGGAVCEIGDEQAIESVLRDVIAGRLDVTWDPAAAGEYEYRAVAGRLLRGLEWACSTDRAGRGPAPV